MPVVFRHRGYRYGFYSNEGDPREPPHVHVSKDGIDAKFWLGSDVEVAYNRGYPDRVVRDLTEIVIRRQALLRKAWNDHFSASDPG